MKELRRRLDAESAGDWVRRPEIEERFRKTLPERTKARTVSPSGCRRLAVKLRS